MPDIKRSLAESILALIAGRESAAAILGDLTEMAALRGRLWFFVAYLRTLIALGWRAPTAFLIALAVVNFSGHTIRWVQKLIYVQMNSDGLFGGYNIASYTQVPWRPPVRMWVQDIAVYCLIFALAFAWAAFGWRNRITRLACALLLLALPIYSLRPMLMDLSGIFTILTIVGALLLSQWRKSMLILAATCLALEAPIWTWICIFTLVSHAQMSPSQYLFCLYIGFVLAAILCLCLQARFVERRTTIAGATHA